MFIKCLILLLAPSFLSAGLFPHVDQRIIGGRSIDIEQAPWQVSLQLHGSHHCGGSIYDQRTIITAAHCFFYLNYTAVDIKDLYVSVGSSSRHGRTLNGVEKRLLYPGYDINVFYNNDIAVLRLSKDLVFNKKVQPISLAKREPQAGTHATATGWGTYSFTLGIFGIQREYPEYLQQIHKRIISVDKHQGKLIRTEAGTCDGDSGGPLVVNRELVGICSGGYEFCDTSAFFTNVFHLQDWILSAIKSLNSNN